MKKKQINIEMMEGRKEGISICENIFPGSIPFHCFLLSYSYHAVGILNAL
jgi:hypothetical protein